VGGFIGGPVIKFSVDEASLVAQVNALMGQINQQVISQNKQISSSISSQIANPLIVQAAQLRALYSTGSIALKDLYGGDGYKSERSINKKEFSMRLRTIRRTFARLLDKSSDRKIRDLQRRAGELEAAFHRVNDTIPALNAAALAAGKLDDPKQLASVLRTMATNYAASSLILTQWADVCESASKLVVKE
jgi:hypothetical protein